MRAPVTETLSGYNPDDSFKKSMEIKNYNYNQSRSGYEEEQNQLSHNRFSNIVNSPEPEGSG